MDILKRVAHLGELEETGTALKQINIEKEYDKVTVGSIVVTDTQSYFIAVSIGGLKIEDKNFFVISPQSPLYLAMTGHKKNDTFIFRDKTHKIMDVF